jgi:cell division septation protein DedD
MRIKWSLLLAALAALVLAGCSEDQKKEAAKLEQELMEREAEQSEAALEPVGDTSVAEEPEMNAGAIPEEPEEDTDFMTGPVGSGYTVQVASCESRDYAEYLAAKYTERGFTSYITTFTHNGQLYYRVRVGPFDTRAQAAEVKAKIDDKYSVSGWIDTEQ